MNITISNSLEQISEVHKSFSLFANGLITDHSLIRRMNVVIDEVLSNIIEHGYSSTNLNQIEVRCQFKSEILELTFIDDGLAFNPLLVEEPDTTTALEQRKLGGLGVHLMKNLVDDLEYFRKENQNHLVLKKYVP